VNLPPESALPDEFTLVIAVYVVGGWIPIPTPGIDHSLVYPLALRAALRINAKKKAPQSGAFL